MKNLDAVIVGAGFAGLYAIYQLRQLGLQIRAFEKGDDVGGVWYWNRYPGARCDVESMQYSFAFSNDLQQSWRWKERFAPQPEILSYAQHVADSFELREHIQFNTSVISAYFNESTSRWDITTSDQTQYSAQFFLMATGCLSSARIPDFEGLNTFKGKTFHTGQWPKTPVDFSGQRVGVIGTGSSGIQIIPMIAQQAQTLHVFQRTANFSIPARNQPMDDTYERQWKDNYPQLRERAKTETTSGTLYTRSTRKATEVDAVMRQQEYERRWQTGGVNFMYSFKDLMTDIKSNETAADFVRAQIRSTVKNQDVANLLAPTEHPLGSKRICIDTDYFQIYNKSNVTLVDVKKNPIQSFTGTGLKTSNAHYELDAMVFATGYDAMTGSFLGINIRGRQGHTLKNAWKEGPKAYLGLMVADFPNLFTITGPGSPSVLAQMIFAIEQHVDWISQCIYDLQKNKLTTIEAKTDAQEQWAMHVNEVAHQTLFVQANSWYLGANIPNKPRVFMPYAGGVMPYRQKCEEVAANDYEGFKRD